MGKYFFFFFFFSLSTRKLTMSKPNFFQKRWKKFQDYLTCRNKSDNFFFFFLSSLHGIQSRSWINQGFNHEYRFFLAFQISDIRSQISTTIFVSISQITKILTITYLQDNHPVMQRYNDFSTDREENSWRIIYGDKLNKRCRWRLHRKPAFPSSWNRQSDLC